MEDERGYSGLNHGQVRLKVEILLHDYFYDMFEKEGEWADRADSCACRIMELFEEMEKDVEDSVWDTVENMRYNGEGLA